MSDCLDHRRKVNEGGQQVGESDESGVIEEGEQDMLGIHQDLWPLRSARQLGQRNSNDNKAGDCTVTT
jgi:hypothetical protein